jgi:hypothetical protein
MIEDDPMTLVAPAGGRTSRDKRQENRGPSASKKDISESLSSWMFDIE